MIVPKVFRNNKSCALIYLDQHLNPEIFDRKFNADSAIIYGITPQTTELIFEKLGEQGLEIRVVVTKKEYSALDNLKKKDFDILELHFNGDMNVKKKITSFGKEIEIYLDETDPKKADLMLWNLKEFKKVFVSEKLRGRLKNAENVQFF